MARVTVFGDSDTGLVRASNQDTLLIEPELGLVGVFDGVGGHRAGDVASALAARVVAGEVASGAALAPALSTAHHRIVDKADRDPELAGMATTAVAVRFDAEGAGELVWVGDSRCYLVHKGQGNIEQVSRDHSLVQEWVDQGVITPQEARNHPMANLVSQVLGQPDPPGPERRELYLAPDVVLLLCSDGLNAVLEDDEIACLCCRYNGRQRISALIDAVRKRGAPDNVTVVTVESP